MCDNYKLMEELKSHRPYLKRKEDTHYAKHRKQYRRYLNSRIKMRERVICSQARETGAYDVSDNEDWDLLISQDIDILIQAKKSGVDILYSDTIDID